MAETYDLESLAAAAKRGDATAQYRLAALLVQSEDEAERGVEWLRKAAAAGHHNARYTLALMTLKGHHVPRKPARAVSLLESLPVAEHPPARQLLAALYAMGTDGKAPDWPRAIALTLEAAGGEDPGALKDIGMILTAVGHSDAAHAFLMAAATRGDLMAAAALVACFGDGDDRIDPSVARTWAEGLARAGHPLAPVWAAAIDAEPTPDAPPPSPVPALDEGLKAQLEGALVETRALRPLMARPQVSQLDAFVSRPLAAHLIAMARPYLQAPQEGEAAPLRALLGVAEIDLSVALVAARIASAARGLPVPAPVLVEACPPGTAAPLTEGRAFGDARVTAILGLSDVTDGGGLSFGGSGDVVRPAPGCLMLMHHHLDDGAPDSEAQVVSVPGDSAVRWHLVRVIE